MTNDDQKGTTFAAMKGSIEGRWQMGWPNNPMFAPLHRGIGDTLRATDELLAHGASLRQTGKFSSRGLHDEIREWAKQKTVLPIRRTAMAAENALEAHKTTRSGLVVSKVDPTDVSAALLRGEMRNWLSSLSSAAKMQALTHSNVPENLLLAALEVPPAMIGLTSDMLKQVEDVAISGKFETELQMLDQLKEAIDLTNSVVAISIHELRKEAGFSRSEDAAFDKWMTAASAQIDEHAQQPPITTHLGEKFSEDLRKTFDEIWAKGFPELYPNHPVNRTKQPEI